MAQPLLSVVIPCYNEERYLGRCLDSLAAQAYRRHEIILVDDGSRDATPRIAAERAKRDKRVRLVRQANAGPGAARNRGARLAKGSILVFVDADMVFDPAYLGELTRPVREGKAVGTTHTRELVANKERLWARSWSINRIPDDIERTGSGVFRAVRKDAFLASGGFDASRGYFDDNLSKLGLATPVRATCYHNNPETLREAFAHSRWVGRSLVRNPETRTRFLCALAASWLALGALAALIALRRYEMCAAAAGIGAAFLFAFLVGKATPRIVAECRAEYVFSIPVLWLVRIAGYWAGASWLVVSGAAIPHGRYRRS